MRRLLLTLSVAVACVALAQPLEAQLKYGVQGAYMTGLEEVSAAAAAAGAADFNGTFGLGARAALQPPLLPIGVVAQGVYYFPEGDGSYMTGSLAAQLRLPMPMVSPYAIGGWQWRRTSGGGSSDTQNGPMVGLGVQLNLVGPSIFLEGIMELSNDEIPGFADFDVNPIVIKGGFLLG